LHCSIFTGALQHNIIAAALQKGLIFEIRELKRAPKWHRRGKAGTIPVVFSHLPFPVLHAHTQ